MQTSRITSWSYSRLATFKQCPYKAKLLYIDKLVEPESEAMKRGSDIHKKLELYLKGESNTLPAEAGIYKKMLQSLKKQKKKFQLLYTEYQVAFNKDLEQVDWFHRNIWLRGVFDVVYIDEEGDAYIIDYKTGKRRPEHERQADMYAVLFYLWNKEYFKLKDTNRWSMLNIAFWYLDDNKIETMQENVYNKETCEVLLKYYIDAGRRITDTTDFPKNPTRLCDWCYFKKSGACHD